MTELVQRNTALGRLSFTTSYDGGLRHVEFVFIAVPTPKSGDHGGADLRYVREAATQIAETLTDNAIVIDKSTVPIGTGDLVTQTWRSIVQGLYVYPSPATGSSCVKAAP